LIDPDLKNKLAEWQFYYNYFRPHGSLNGKTPIEVENEHSAQAPFWDEVEKENDSIKKRIHEQAYWLTA
jgi:hypothetical protein